MIAQFLRLPESLLLATAITPGFILYSVTFGNVCIFGPLID